MRFPRVIGSCSANWIAVSPQSDAISLQRRLRAAQCPHRLQLRGCYLVFWEYRATRAHTQRAQTRAQRRLPPGEVA